MYIDKVIREQVETIGRHAVGQDFKIKQVVNTIDILELTEKILTPEFRRGPVCTNMIMFLIHEAK